MARRPTRLVVAAAAVLLSGCSHTPAGSPVTLSSTVAVAPSGCKAALPPEQVAWSAQSTDGIDAWWVGTEGGRPVQMRVFDAMQKADRGLPLVGLWICVAR